MLQLTDPADASKAFPEMSFDWVKLGTERFFVKRVVVDLDGRMKIVRMTLGVDIFTPDAAAIGEKELGRIS